MMKIKLLLGALLISSFCFAQFTESFETSIPSTWTIINGGGANSWIRLNNPTNGAQDGTAVASISFNSTAHDDYLITPAINVTTGLSDRLSLHVKSRSATFLEPYEIRLSTTGTAAVDFNVVLQASTLAPVSWQRLEFDLSSYASQTVYVAIRATGTNEFELHADNFVNDAAPSCVEPSSINSSNITSTTANFSWTDSASETAGYNWEVVPAGNAQGVGVVASGTTAANAVATMATGLSSSTAYSFRIQSNCGGGNLSTWSTAVNFTTTAACGDTVYDTGGPTANYANNENYTITYFPDAPGNVVTLNFTQVALENCCDVLRVYNGIDTAAAPFTLDLENPASFRATNPAGAITLRFTSDFSSVGAGWTANYTCAPPPNCLEPTVLTASNFTTTSANLSWTSGGSGEMAWQVSYGTGTFLPSAGTIVTAGSNPFNLTGLMGGTIYQYYVRANCTGGDNSAWAGPFSFRIPALGEACTAPVVMPLEASCSTATPFTLDFATAADLGGAFTCDTTTANFGKWFEFTASSTSAFSMNVSLAGLEYALFSTCGTELLCGGLSNTAPNLIFGLTEGATYRVAIWRDGTSSLSSTVCFQDGPTCINPDTLTASNITDTTAELGWRDVNALNTTASASFEVEYGVGTFAQGSGTTVLSPVGNPTTITGLTANTIYNYYVRANCGGGGFSVWSGPFGF
ncbi:MAG: choice-of-anchor J domain-containing protein, partial [Nonlabens sp.]|nr:choice-of-anchor J domain-containing protein [Nonlabens sp.]